MRPLSFRALLLALVMVVQTIAGGASIARTMPGGADPAVFEHCEKASSAAGDLGDSSRDGRRHHCQACCLCAGPPTAALPAGTQLPVALGLIVRASFALADTSAIPARIELARLARGPPAAPISA